MKNLLLLSTLLCCNITWAQKSCCKASTTEFAALGAQDHFLMAHQLPKSGSQNKSAGKWMEFKTPDGKTGRAYMVKTNVPSDKYLFVFHEWWGLNENITNEADVWAANLGDVNVIALDLYDGKIATTREAAGALMQSADEIRIRNIIQGAINFVGPKAQVATMGWCFGGGWSMQAAIMLENQAKGCVIYYGMPEKNKEILAPLNCKVVGFFAEKDEWINRKVVAEYEKSMTELGKPYETHWYDAEHAFANPSNPIFDEAATAKTKEILNVYFREIF